MPDEKSGEYLIGHNAAISEAQEILISTLSDIEDGHAKEIVSNALQKIQHLKSRFQKLPPYITKES